MSKKQPEELGAKEQSMLILFVFVEKKDNLSFNVQRAGFEPANPYGKGS